MLVSINTCHPLNIFIHCIICSVISITIKNKKNYTTNDKLHSIDTKGLTLPFLGSILPIIGNVLPIIGKILPIGVDIIDWRWYDKYTIKKGGVQ